MAVLNPAGFPKKVLTPLAMSPNTEPGAALAAVLHEGVARVTLIGAPTSYADMAETRYQQWPESAMLSGVLTSFDLPDLYRELAGKGLELIEPRDAQMQ